MRQQSLLCLAVLLIGVPYGSVRGQEETVEGKTPKAEFYKPKITAQAEATPSDKFFNLRQQKFRMRMPGPRVPEDKGIEAKAAAAPFAETDVDEPSLTKATGKVSVRSRALKTSEHGQTSTVCEPSLAVKGKTVFLTGNWFASLSKNSGTSFAKVDPYTRFPAPPNRPFCCDQIAHYHAGTDVMFWLLQHVNDSTGNILRLAVAAGPDIPTQKWHYYDFSPQSIGPWDEEWFDYPDLAMTDGHLFITVNTFSTTSDQFQRSVVIRIPLDQLKTYSALTYRVYQTNQVFSLRGVQGAGDTMYLAAHKSNAALRVFTWPDSATAVTNKDVTVKRWSDADRVAPGPDGRDWVGRSDGRITAAFMTKAGIGFGWSGAQDTNFSFPHVRVAIIDPATMKSIAQPHLWNSEFAFAYPAACPAKNGAIGFAVHFGGGTEYFPSHAVGVLLASGGTGMPWSWKLVQSATGTHGPEDGKWGDYQAVRSDGTNWFATGYTLQGGSTRGFIVPQFIRFSHGLTKDTPQVPPTPTDIADVAEQLRQLREEVHQLRLEIEQLVRRLPKK